MALQHGVNANLLRTWMTRHRRQRELVSQPALAMATTVGSAFVPVVAKTPARSRPMRFGAQLPNGIKLDWSEVDPDELALLLRLLSELPCSGSTPG
jgi:transposase